MSRQIPPSLPTPPVGRQLGDMSSLGNTGSVVCRREKRNQNCLREVPAGLRVTLRIGEKEQPRARRGIYLTSRWSASAKGESGNNVGLVPMEDDLDGPLRDGDRASDTCTMNTMPKRGCIRRALVCAHLASSRGIVVFRSRIPYSYCVCAQ
jgi:hypothetical protein